MFRSLITGGLATVAMLAALALSVNDVSTPRTAQASAVDLTLLLKLHYDRISYSGGFLALELFTDDAEMQRGSECPAATPCIGKAQIARRVDLEVIFEGRYTFLSLQQSGDTVTARAELTDLFIRSVVSRQIVNITATFRGDKIAKLVQTPDLSDPQTAQFQSANARLNGTASALFRAIERADIAAAMALFSDDAVFEGFGLCAAARCAGRAAIQREIEREAADKPAFSSFGGSFRISGDTLTSVNQIRSDSIRAAGVERILVNRTVEVPGAKIVLLRLIPDASDAQTARFLGQGPAIRAPSTGDAGIASAGSARLVGLLGLLPAALVAVAFGWRLRNRA